MWPWLLLGLLALTVAAAAAWWLLRRRRAAKAARRKRPAKPRVAPRNPVVLAHGLFGFDEIRLPGGRVEYWKGIPSAIRKMGAEVAVPRFGSTAGVSTRSKQLADVILKMPGERVNVIAHSMGGVDARVAIARLGCGSKVASLVTIATPHRGTPLADLSRPFLRGNRRERLAEPALAADGGEPDGTDAPTTKSRRKKSRVDVRGLVDARPDAMKRLNRRIPDDARVHYASVISAVDGVRGVHPLLVPGYLYLSGAAGRNDGVVPESSQAWGDVLAQVEADHWGVVGWSRKFDAKDFYRSILRELAARGF